MSYWFVSLSFVSTKNQMNILWNQRKQRQRAVIYHIWEHILVCIRACNVRLRLKRDGTRAGTRFRLSPKWTSPFKSAGRQLSRLLAAEVCASALVMLDTPRSKVEWEYCLPTPFSRFPFISPPVLHLVPSGFKRTLPMSNHITALLILFSFYVMLNFFSAFGR